MANASSGAPLAPCNPFCIFSGSTFSRRPKMRTTIGDTVIMTSECKYSMMISEFLQYFAKLWHDAYEVTWLKAQGSTCLGSAGMVMPLALG